MPDSSHTVSAAFRSCVSDGDIAFIASAMLQDAKLITEEGKNLVVDKNKILRKKKKLEKKGGRTGGRTYKWNKN